MPASSSVRSKKDPGRSASSLARVLGRSEAGLSGARPFFWAAIRATWLRAGVVREAAASAVRASVPLRASRATEGDLRKPNRGWRLSGTGLRPHEPKTTPAWKRLLHCWDLFIPHGTETRDKLSASSDFSAFQRSKRQLAWTCQSWPNANLDLLATRVSWTHKIFDPANSENDRHPHQRPIPRTASVTPARKSAIRRLPLWRDFRGNKTDARNRADLQ